MCARRALHRDVEERLQSLYERQPQLVGAGPAASPAAERSSVPEQIRRATEGVAAPSTMRPPLPNKIVPRHDGDVRQPATPERGSTPER